MRHLVVVSMILFMVGCQSSGELDQTTDSGTYPASDKPAALVLNKEPIFEIDGTPRGAGCEGLYKVSDGRNVSDMRDFRYYSCQGRYTLTLSGNAGTTVTLFGKFNFQKENGFLVVVKTDNRKVWAINLDDIPREQWVSVPAGRKTGAYDVYVKGSRQFSQLVSSVQWGKWWQGNTPE